MALTVNELVLGFLRDKRAFKLDDSLVKQLASDMRRMTKIYRSIPGNQTDPKFGKYFNEAYRLFRTFRDNWNDLIYEKILDKPSSDESYWAKELRSKAWAARHDLDPYMLGFTRDGPNSEFLRRDTNMRRYQKSWRAALKALSDYIEHEGGVRYDDEKFRLSGVQVVIKAKGRREEHESEIRAFLASLGNQVKRIQQAGFGKAVQGMTVVISLKPDDFQEAGRYEPAADTLFLGYMGISPKSKTFTHEVGHRYYFKVMPSGARRYWEDMINKRSVTITADHIKEFVAKYGVQGTDREALAKIEREVTEPTKREVFKHLVGQRPVFTSDPSEIERFMMKHVGERANMEFITEYGATDAWEAFAEAWQLYILKGPRRLGEWTRWFFETVSSGGRKLADLAPPLGYPGGTCQVVERIEDNVRNPKLQDQLETKVERGKSLSNPEAAKVYKVEIERGPWKFKRLVLTIHAQYRMDLRGLTVPEVRMSLGNYFRAYNDLKSRNDPKAQAIEMAMMRREKVTWTDPKLGATLVFTADINRGQIDVISLWWEGQPDPGPAKSCDVHPWSNR